MYFVGWLPWNAGASKYGFNGIEKDDEVKGSGNSYDYGARIYDARLGRWLSLDPLQTKYPQLSPYNFVDNSPIRCKDADGRDIIVLCAPVALTKDPEAVHPTGHQAALIGNDKDGWDFYSFDADKKSQDGTNNDFTNGKHFKSLDEFKNSDYNSFKDDYDDGKGTATSHKDKDGKIVQRFEDGYRITTSKATDKLMRKGAQKPFEEAYSIVKGNQCTSVVEGALDAGGLKNGNITRMNPGMPYAFDKQNQFPQDKQQEIEKKNPGIDVDDAINRTDGATPNGGLQKPDRSLAPPSSTGVGKSTGDL